MIFYLFPLVNYKRNKEAYKKQQHGRNTDDNPILDKKNAIFIFRFDNNDTETLDGWKGKGSNDSFNILPDVRFIKGNTDATLTYGPGTYFGNIGLRNIDKIQKKINDISATHVIFVPAKFQDHVYYKVFLSKEPHTLARKTLALIPAGDNTNPSPPKQYN